MLRAVLLALLAPALLSAQLQRTVEVGAFAHYTVLDNDDLLGTRSVGIGARLGVFALPSLSVEGEYTFGTIKENVRGVASWIPFRGYAVGHAAITSNTRAFLGVGYKFDGFIHDQTDNKYRFAFTALAGVRRCFGAWSVRPDIAYDRNSRASQYFAFRIGVSRFYGRGAATCGAADTQRDKQEPAARAESPRPAPATRQTNPPASKPPAPPAGPPAAATPPVTPPVTPPATSTRVSVTLSATPTSVQTNGSTTLTWSSTNARSCEAPRPRPWTAQTRTSGSESVQLQIATTYWIVCRGSGGRDSAFATVSIFIPPPPSLAPPPPPPVLPPTVALDVVRIIEEGESTALAWRSTDATSCNTQSPRGWGASTGATGVATISPVQTTTYTIQCTGPRGTVTASTTVEVIMRPRTLRILGSVLFRFDSTNVNPGRPSTDPQVRAALDSLNALAERMNNSAPANVTVVGNTDFVGTDAQNNTVSYRRARAVYVYLRSRVTNPEKFANTVAWACGETNADQSTPQPPERGGGRYADRNVTVYVNQPSSVVKATACIRIAP